jgi:hypothetical protein
VSKLELFNALSRRVAPWLVAELVRVVKRPFQAHPEFFQMLGAYPAGEESHRWWGDGALVAVVVGAPGHVDEECFVERCE